MFHLHVGESESTHMYPLFGHHPPVADADASTWHTGRRDVDPRAGPCPPPEAEPKQCVCSAKDERSVSSLEPVAIGKNRPRRTAANRGRWDGDHEID